MFKCLLIIFIFWCEILRYHVFAQIDTVIDSPSLLLPINKQNISALAEELSKKPVITMNGHNNYHVGQQIFYIYHSSKQSSPINKNGYLFTSGIGAHKLHNRKLIWNKARQACIQEGGHLAVINSDSEEKILLSMLQEKNIDAGWLGVHDLYEEGDWVTVTDEALENTGYSKWSTKWPNEPDNFDGNQNCGLLIKEGGMDDVKCASMHSFFCEISA
ncbi:hemolymph lipopolysaccharide-binding protein-like [Pogonomyrmex barbatus]|uniref:Hemolymph lipopolysaccharide-binding protein-like n=1 Tax=Pogonomyrmex barbatus TaxID=144034 RepID=A0A6I9WL79_9HYME|nr:hemolymph lipopolysaccharide-binding protein-like [Pogonomyrmex barbatus]